MDCALIILSGVGSIGPDAVSIRELQQELRLIVQSGNKKEYHEPVDQGWTKLVQSLRIGLRGWPPITPRMACGRYPSGFE